MRLQPDFAAAIPLPFFQFALALTCRLATAHTTVNYCAAQKAEKGLKHVLATPTPASPRPMPIGVAYCDVSRRSASARKSRKKASLLHAQHVRLFVWLPTDPARLPSPCPCASWRSFASLSVGNVIKPAICNFRL